MALDAMSTHLLGKLFFNITIVIIIIKIYLPHSYLQWIFVLQKKKTIKINKNVKIYQYITVNTKKRITKL